MKKIIFILAMMLTGIQSIEAQNKVVIIGSAIEVDGSIPGLSTGFIKGRSKGYDNTFENGCILFYDIQSKEKDFSIGFAHFNFNFKELAKLREINDNDRKRMTSGTYHPFDAMFENVKQYKASDILNMSQTEVWDWALKLYSEQKPIYIVDYSDINPATGRARYYEVKIDIGTIPETYRKRTPTP